MLRGTNELEKILARSHAPVITCEAVSYTGGYLGDLPLVGGSVSMSRTSQVRRTASLVFKDTPRVREITTTPGAQVRVAVGAVVGRTPQTIPVHWGLLGEPKKTWRSGKVEVSSPDLFQLLARDSFERPRQSPAGFTVAQAIQQLVGESMPSGIGFEDQSGIGVVCARVTWDESRPQAVTELASAIGCEVFLRPDGVVVLRVARRQPRVPGR